MILKLNYVVVERIAKPFQKQWGKRAGPSLSPYSLVVEKSDECVLAAFATEDGGMFKRKGDFSCFPFMLRKIFK